MLTEPVFTGLIALKSKLPAFVGCGNGKPGGSGAALCIEPGYGGKAAGGGACPGIGCVGVLPFRC